MIRFQRMLNVPLALIFTCVTVVCDASANASSMLSEHATPPDTQDKAAGERNAQDKASPDGKAAQYLRVVEQAGKSISLEIASRTFTRPEKPGPSVALVGVAHIADRTFYRNVEKLLREYDVVLYESVKPPGTGGAGGATDDERIESTRAAMKFVASVVKSHRARLDAYPADLDALKTYATQRDPRLVQFLNAALVDAWGNKLVYELHAPAAEVESATFELRSLGADGAPGGEGVNADFTHHADDEAEPLELSADDGLQSQLADALGLEFQLTSLPYDEPNWRCSDMAMDEVSRRLAAKGVNFDLMGGTLAGSSLPAKMIKLLLGMMKMFDAMTEGAITDTFKVVLIEVLGDPSVLDKGLAQFGGGFAEVIVADRNQVVVDDLARLIEAELQVKSVAILYGAAHMPDLAERLREQLGYQPMPAEDDVWISAITVDLTQSKVTQRDLAMIRRTMKQAIRQQMR